jgi:ribosomal protein S17
MGAGDRWYGRWKVNDWFDGDYRILFGFVCVDKNAKKLAVHLVYGVEHKHLIKSAKKPIKYHKKAGTL